MTSRGWLIKCPHPGCTWEQFNHTQDAANKAYNRHNHSRHRSMPAPKPNTDIALQFDLNTDLFTQRLNAATGKEPQP